MSQTLKAFINQRLSAAAEEIFELFERTIAEYEDELCRQRQLLDGDFRPELWLQRGDVQLLLVSKDDEPPQQQEWSPSLDREDPPELPDIKEEQDQLEEADITKLTFTPVPVKSEEDDEEKPLSSQLHQIPTDHIKTESDGEDCGGPETARDSDPDTHLQLYSDDKSSDFSEPETKVSQKRSELQSGLNFVKKIRVYNASRRSFSCSECGKRFSQKSNLKTHMRTHTGEKPFSCPICNKRYTQKINLTHHMALHTGEKRYSCSICGKRFTRPYQLKKHQCEGPQSFQLNESQNEENRVVEHLKAEADGEYCGGSEPATNFNPDSHLHSATHEEHIKTEADGEDCGGSEPAKSLNPDSNLQAPVREPFACTVCGKAFALRARMTRHMKTHTGERPYGCSICGRRFAHSSVLTKHLRVHTGEKPFGCLVCGRRFARSSTLTSHLRIHTGEKPFTCPICKASFSFRSNYSLHMRMHTGEKPFSCTVCGKEFARKAHLRQHTTVHTGEKPFSCSLCGKRFAQKTNMKQHMFIHTRDKPIGCSICGKGTEERCREHSDSTDSVVYCVT